MPGDEELSARLQALIDTLPDGLELARLLQNLDDPANDEWAKDRYTALVAGGAVDEALRAAIERREGKARRRFKDRIDDAEALGLITHGQAVELEKIRMIRNVFAHSLRPVGFKDAIIADAMRGVLDHPVTSYAGYFAPAFHPRHQFAIVCGEFYDHLTRQR